MKVSKTILVSQQAKLKMLNYKCKGEIYHNLIYHFINKTIKIDINTSKKTYELAELKEKIGFKIDQELYHLFKQECVGENVSMSVILNDLILSNDLNKLKS